MAIGWKQDSTRRAGRTGFGENPTVTSKNVRRYGRDPEGDVHGSTGEQPAKLCRDPVPPSLPPKVHTDRAPPAGSVAVAGWDPQTGKFVPASHPHTGMHGSDDV